MISTPILRIGGVPEHFNIPIYYGADQQVFAAAGINVSWTSYPGGTGAMLADLSDGIIDMATVLTEGAVAGIMQGVPVKIIKFYVDSPLIWGIHTAHNAGIGMHTLEGKKYAISRFNSGSHLMPLVNANQLRITVSDDDFLIVKNLEGARIALRNKEADLFFWEKFITQPYVDNHDFDRIGECPTPWPSFVFVAREDVLENHYEAISSFFTTLHRLTADLINSGNVIRMVADEFGLSHFDAVQWYAQVEWNMDSGIDTEKMASVINRLQDLGIIPPLTLDESITRLVYPKAIADFTMASRH